MTLRELRAAYPHLFYPQDWFEREAFMDLALPELAPRRRPDYVQAVDDPTEWPLQLAVTLAATYVREPDAAIWYRYLWCADTDRQGQRVYIGGVSTFNGNRLEIHRHLRITERWGVPRWS